MLPSHPSLSISLCCNVVIVMFISPSYAPDTTTKSTLALRFKDFRFVSKPYFSFFSRSALNPPFQAYRITEEMALKISCGSSIKRGCVRWCNVIMRVQVCKEVKTRQLICCVLVA